MLEESNATGPGEHPIFQQLVSDAVEPDLSGWEHFENLHQFQFYRRIYNNSKPYGLALDEIINEVRPLPKVDPAATGPSPSSTTEPHGHTPAAEAQGGGVLYEYRVKGVFADVEASVLDQVYTDLNYRKAWDVNMLGYDELGPQQYQYTVKYPFPLTNREYVYRIHKHTVVHQGRTYYVTLGSSLTEQGNYSGIPDRLVSAQTKLPKPSKGRTRVKQYFQALVVSALPIGRGCQVAMHYFENPDGHIPAFIINWVVKAGVPAFVKNLRDACHKTKDR